MNGRAPTRPARGGAWPAVVCLPGMARGPGRSRQQTGGRPAGGGDEPIEITADRLVLEQNQQLATFTGNVDAVQGDTTLRTDKLRVFYTSDEERQASRQPAERAAARGRRQRDHHPARRDRRGRQRRLRRRPRARWC